MIGKFETTRKKCANCGYIYDQTEHILYSECHKCGSNALDELTEILKN